MKAQFYTEALARFANQLETRVDPLQVAQQIRALLKTIERALSQESGQ